MVLPLACSCWLWSACSTGDSGGDPAVCVEGLVTQRCVCGTSTVNAGYCCSAAPQAAACGADPIEPPILGEVHYVSATGPDNFDDADHGTDTAPWRTIRYAVSQLQPGDTLMVRRGYYTEAVTVNVSGTSDAPVTIRAEKPYTARLNGGLTISGNYITVYGMDIEQPAEGYGVIINAVTGTQLLANHIHDCPFCGIRVASHEASGYRIRKNVLSYNGQAGIAIRGSNGVIEENQILEVVAFHPKLGTNVNINNGNDADGITLRGSGHVIRRNLIANYADPLDTHNYYLPNPIHNAHADCFDVRELTDTVIEGNYCWSNFHVSKGLIFNGGSQPAANITVRNNIFEYRDIGLSAYENPVSSLYVYNNLMKARLRDEIPSYLYPGTIAQIPGFGIVLGNVDDYLVFNNITVDCDNRNEQNAGDPNTTGNPVEVSGGTGVSDYNFCWNSDGAAFIGATPGAHGSIALDPAFESFDTTIHGGNDYRLNPASHLIGLGTAGLTSATGFVGVTDDIDGVARPQGGSYEPGPHEFVANALPGPASSISEHASHSILTLTPTSCASPASAVAVEIAKWKGNREAALVLQFDDGTPGHALCGLPALHERNLTGTWYIVPGADGFTTTLNPPVTNQTIALPDRWAQAPALGQELANHTMHHDPASDYATWRAEVGSAADVIWRIRHGEPLQRNGSLIAFNTSANTAWPWTPKDKVAILSEFDNIDRLTNMGPPYHVHANTGYSVPTGASAEAMYCAGENYTINPDGSCADASGTVVQRGIPLALGTSTVYTTCFHGILSTADDNCQAYTSGSTDRGIGGVAFSELEKYLDRVAALTSRVWVAGQIQLWKYTQERQRSSIRMHQACSDRVYFDLASSLGPLYDEPLTLMVTVPSDWNTCTAFQGSVVKPCTIGAGNRALLDVVPNKGRILLVKGS